MNSGCLGYGEAGGMGEGWGDALATLIRQVEEHKQFGYAWRSILWTRKLIFSNGTDIFSMGAWAANRVQGIRNYAYTTNSTTNPSTYKTLDKVSQKSRLLLHILMTARILGCSRHWRGLG